MTAAMELPTALLLPPLTAVALCLVAAYAAAVGLYLVSAAHGGYDPVVGTQSIAVAGNGTACATQVASTTCHCSAKFYDLLST
jgi:hypothetical protein